MSDWYFFACDKNRLGEWEKYTDYEKSQIGKVLSGKHTDYVIFVVKIHIMGKFCRWSTQI